MQNKLEWAQSASLITKTTEYRNTLSHLLILYFICMNGFQLQIWGKGFWSGNLKEIDNLEDLALDGMIILKSFINPMTPNDHYSGRTVPLTSKIPFYIFIQQI